jgi:hypothetical protein
MEHILGIFKQKSVQNADTAAATNLKELTAALRFYIIMNNSSCIVFYFPVFFVVLSLSNHGNFLLSSNKQQQQKLFALQYSIFIKEFE